MGTVAIVLIILFIIFTLVFSYILFVFLFDIKVRLKIKKYINFIDYDDAFNFDNKINSINEKISSSNDIFSSFKDDAVSFFDDIYMPSKIIFKSKLNDLIKNNHFSFFNQINANKKIDELENLLKKNNVYIEKQNYLIEKIYDYFNNSSEVFIHLKRAISKTKKRFNQSNVDIPSEIFVVLESSNNRIYKIEKKYSFLTSEFGISIDELKNKLDKNIDIAENFLNSYLNIELMKSLIPFLEENIDYTKTKMIGSYPTFSMQLSSIKDNIYYLKSDIQKNYIVEANIENLIKTTYEKIESLLINYSNEYRFKKLVDENLSQISYVPRELDIRNSTLVSELKNKQLLNYQDQVEKIHMISDNINKNYAAIMSFRNQTLLKYSDYAKLFKKFFESLEEYLQYTNQVANQINSFNQTKKNITETLSQISIELLDCEWKLKQLPDIYKQKYTKLIENYSQKTNEYIKNYKTKEVLFHRDDYEKVLNFLYIINSLKANIYTDIYLIKYIEESILNLNRFKTLSEELTNYISEIESLYFSGDINTSLRLIVKVLDLYEIYL